MSMPDFCKYSAVEVMCCVCDCVVLLQLSRRLEEVETVIRTYHGQADRLKLIPATAKRAQGVDFEIKFNARASRADDMISLDLKQAIQPLLAKLRNSFHDRKLKAQEELMVVREQLHEKEETVHDCKEAIQQFQAQLTRVCMYVCMLFNLCG